MSPSIPPPTLRELLWERIQRDYQRLPSEALYEVFTKLIEDRRAPGPPAYAEPVGAPPLGDPVAMARHMHHALAWLLYRKHTNVSVADLSVACGEVVSRLDALRRTTGAYVVVSTPAEPVHRHARPDGVRADADGHAEPVVDVRRSDGSPIDRPPLHPNPVHAEPAERPPVERPAATSHRDHPTSELLTTDELGNAKYSSSFVGESRRSVFERPRDTSHTEPPAPPPRRQLTPSASVPVVGSLLARLQATVSWDPARQLVDLHFPLESAYQEFAIAVVRDRTLTIELTPPPIPHSAVQLVLTVEGRGELQTLGGACDEFTSQGQTTLLFSDLPRELRNVAFAAALETSTERPPVVDRRAEAAARTASSFGSAHGARAGSGNLPGTGSGPSPISSGFNSQLRPLSQSTTGRHLRVDPTGSTISPEAPRMDGSSSHVNLSHDEMEARIRARRERAAALHRAHGDTGAHAATAGHGSTGTHSAIPAPDEANAGQAARARAQAAARRRLAEAGGQPPESGFVRSPSSTSQPGEFTRTPSQLHGKADPRGTGGFERTPSQVTGAHGAVPPGEFRRAPSSPHPTVAPHAEFRRAPSAPHPVADFHRAPSATHPTVAPAESGFVRSPSQVTGASVSVRASSDHLSAQRPAVGTSEHATVAPLDLEGRLGTGRTGSYASVSADADAVDLTFGDVLNRKSGERVAGGPAALILQAASRCSACRVSIETDHHLWTICLREDVMVSLVEHPLNPRFQLARLVEESGLVDSLALSQAMTAARESGASLIEVLTRSRVLRFRQVDAILGARYQLMLHELFDSNVKRYEIENFDFIEWPSGTTTLHITPLAWDYLRKACEELPHGELEAIYRTRTADWPLYTADSHIRPEHLRMKGKTLRFIEAVLAGDASVTQGIARSPLQRRQSFALLLALDRAGLVTWKHMETESTRVSRLMPAIINKLGEIGSKNPYDALESHWSADEVLVLESWRTLVHTLDLEYVKKHGTHEQAALAMQVERGLLQCRDALRSLPQRQAAREHAIDDFGIRGAIHLYEKQAELALFKSDYPRAIDSWRRICELKPDDAEAKQMLHDLLNRPADSDSD